jgi:hypothetical protein
MKSSDHRTLLMIGGPFAQTTFSRYAPTLPVMASYLLKALRCFRLSATSIVYLVRNKSQKSSSMVGLFCINATV